MVSSEQPSLEEIDASRHAALAALLPWDEGAQQQLRDARDSGLLTEEGWGEIREYVLNDASTRVRFAAKYYPRMRNLHGAQTQESLQGLGLDQQNGATTYFVPLVSDYSIAVEAVGPPNGRRLIFLPGMPGSRFASKPNLCQEYNVRCFTPDLPGYGASLPMPGFRPVHMGHVFEAMYVGIEEFKGQQPVDIFAGSGSTAYALGMLRTPSPLIDKVTLAAPLAPTFAWDDENIWFAGMNEPNRNIFTLAQEDRRQKVKHALGRLLRLTMEDKLVEALRKAPEYADSTANHNVSPSIHEGVRRFLRSGWLDQVLGIVDWGFDPRERYIHDRDITILYGGNDVFSPPQHGEWLAEHIPGAQGISVPPDKDNPYIGSHHDVMSRGQLIAHRGTAA